MSGPVTLKGGRKAQRAKLSRSHVVDATGYSSSGGGQVTLIAKRKLTRGRYTLVLTHRSGRRVLTTRSTVTIP